MNSPLHRCQALLDDLLAQSPFVRFACVGTVDGRLYASPGNAHSGQRFAAMSSALVALSESFAREAMRSQCKYAMTVMDHGLIVSVRVPDHSNSYVFSLGSDHSESMAMVLRRALDSAGDIARILDSAAASG